MVKKVLIALLLILLTGYGLLRYLSHTLHIDYGHHFSFENKLGIEIDSLLITVGDKSTIIIASQDSTHDLEGNISVPETGYPHEVTIQVFSKDESITLEASPFNCYNCDGNHEYILMNSGAQYEFLN